MKKKILADFRICISALLKKNLKAIKGIGIIKKLSNVLPRKYFITIYKSFLRPHFDYGELIYDQPNNESYCQQIERIQYNASLAITGAIKGTSRPKLYTEIGLESLRLDADSESFVPKAIYNVHNPVGLRLPTRLRLVLRHLSQNKFNHNFQDCLNPLCLCSLEVKSLSYFFLHRHYYSKIHSTLLKELQSIDINLLN